MDAVSGEVWFRFISERHVQLVVDEIDQQSDTSTLIPSPASSLFPRQSRTSCRYASVAFMLRTPHLYSWYSCIHVAQSWKLASADQLNCDQRCVQSGSWTGSYDPPEFRSSRRSVICAPHAVVVRVMHRWQSASGATCMVRQVGSPEQNTEDQGADRGDPACPVAWPLTLPADGEEVAAKSPVPNASRIAAVAGLMRTMRGGR